MWDNDAIMMDEETRIQFRGTEAECINQGGIGCTAITVEASFDLDDFVHKLWIGFGMSRWKFQKDGFW